MNTDTETSSSSESEDEKYIKKNLIQNQMMKDLSKS